MSVFDLIEQMHPSFTNTDLIICDRCNKFPDSIAHETVTSLTEITGVSKAALTRFAKKLGFSGFNEFQYQFRQELGAAKEAQKEPRSLQYAEILQNVENAVDIEECRKIAKRIRNAHHVFYTGRYLSRIPAYYMDAATRIFSISDSRYVHADELSSKLDGKSVIILFSVSDGGNYSYVLNKYAEKADPPWRILITLSANHQLRDHFDQVIVLPGVRSPQYFGTTLPETLSFLMFADILNRCLAEADKETE